MLERLLVSENVHRTFLLLQIVIGTIAIAVLWWFLDRRRDPDSNFALRESDRQRPSKRGSGSRDPEERQELARARLDKKKPLQLSGIRIDGAPHEVLGISPRATVDEVKRAYRELMIRYHPDKVGRPGSREWKDAQRIAEAINHAKEQLLSRSRKEPHSQSPKRSGR